MSNAKTHGMSSNKIYFIHNNMNRRIFEKTNKRYDDYGGRGIKICDEWKGKDGFINFYNWSIDNGYEEGLSIERSDVNGNYEPNNCSWITMDEQARNKRNTVWLTINEVTKSLPEWAEISGVHKGTIWFRYNNGYIGEDLIKTTDTASKEKWIYWEERKQRWRVRIRIDNKVKSFGTYPTFNEAIAKRNAVLEEHGMILE